LTLLRLYLFAGLVAHKAIWEILKRRLPPERRKKRGPLPPIALAAKAVKVVLLLGFLAQPFLPTVLPITAEPFALEVAGTILYTVGLATAVAGRVQLGAQWSDIEAAGLLPGHKLVGEGIYRTIRHPIYSGDLTMLLGFELALNSWLALFVLVLIPIVARQALREERMLSDSLPGYAEYRRRTKGFVPFVV
jgi:protein-S-isoprenylcysteine O-methyltransferase Ste14